MDSVPDDIDDESDSQHNSEAYRKITDIELGVVVMEDADTGEKMDMFKARAAGVSRTSPYAMEAVGEVALELTDGVSEP